MYLLLWAIPGLFAIGLISGAFRSTRVVAGSVLAIAAMTVWIAIDGHASLTRGDYCDTGFDCPNLDQAVSFGALTIAVVLIPHLVARVVRNRIGRRRGESDDGAGAGG